MPTFLTVLLLTFLPAATEPTGPAAQAASAGPATATAPEIPGTGLGARGPDDAPRDPEQRASRAELNALLERLRRMSSTRGRDRSSTRTSVPADEPSVTWAFVLASGLIGLVVGAACVLAAVALRAKRLVASPNGSSEHAGASPSPDAPTGASSSEATPPVVGSPRGVSEDGLLVDAVGPVPGDLAGSLVRGTVVSPLNPLGLVQLDGFDVILRCQAGIAPGLGVTVRMPEAFAADAPETGVRGNAQPEHGDRRTVGTGDPLAT